MNATQSIPQISKEEYEALLLIYASYTDLDFSGSEKDEIINSLGFDTYEKANAYYGNMREYELLQHLCDLRKLYYPGSEGKDKVLKMVRTHFNADGDFSKLERTQYNFLKMML